MDKAFTGIKDQDLLILSNLDDKDLLNVCSIKNKYINRICKDEDFWRNRFISKHGEIGIKYKPEKLTWREYYLQVIIDLEKFSRNYPNPYNFLSHILWNKTLEKSFYIRNPMDPPHPNNRKPIFLAERWVISAILYYNYDLKELPVIFGETKIEIKEMITLFELLNLVSEKIQNIPFHLRKFKNREHISLMKYF